MKKINLIWIIGLMLIVSSSVVFAASPTIPLINDTVLTFSRLDGNFTFEGTTCTLGAAGCDNNWSSLTTATKDGTGNFNHIAGQQAYMVHRLFNYSENNWSIDFKINLTSIGTNSVQLCFSSSNNSAANVFCLMKENGGNIEMLGGASHCGGQFNIMGNGWTQMRANFLKNNTVNLFINDTHVCNSGTDGILTNDARQVWFIPDYSGEGSVYQIDNLTFYNGSVYPNNNSNVNIQIFTEGTSTLITPNSVKGSFDSSSYVFNQSTTTGILFAKNVVPGEYTVVLSSSGLTTRRYNFTLNAHQPISFNAYLANSTGLTAVTFVVKDRTTTQTLDAATIKVYDKIGTTYVLIDQQNTNSIGEVIISLDSTKTYRIVTSKSGYTTDTSDFTYTSTPYNINLLSTSSAYPTSIYTGIAYSFLPSGSSLVNGTRYNFTFNMSSTDWAITNCVMTLKNSTDSFLQSSSTFNASRCDITIETGMGNNNTLISSVTYTLNGTYNDTKSQEYSIKYYYQGQFSLKTVIDDIDNFSGAAFNDWSRMFIGFLIIFAITAYVAKKASFVDTDYLIVLFIILTITISYLGWFRLNYDGIPAEWLKQYIISILVLLTGTGIIASRNMG